MNDSPSATSVNRVCTSVPMSVIIDPGRLSSDSPTFSVLVSSDSPIEVRVGAPGQAQVVQERNCRLNHPLFIAAKDAGNPVAELVDPSVGPPTTADYLRIG